MAEKDSTYNVNSLLVRRAQLASALGVQFQGKRDIYKALGYKRELTYADYLAKYLRQEIANAIVARPVKATWKGKFNILQGEDAQETQLEKDWQRLYEKLRVKNVFAQLDTLTCLGRYGVLLLGYGDVKQREDYAKAVSAGKNELRYIKPFGENDARITKYENDVSDERYGLPVLYEIDVGMGGENNRTLQVHHSRVIHVVREKLQSDVYGVPMLETVYNRLDDLERIVGGSAEMFWKGARPGYQGKVDQGYSFKAENVDALSEQVEEMEHELRRFIVSEGLDMKSLATQVSDPTSHVDIQIQMISSATGIPKRILTGSERGEMSSAQDSTEWNKYIQGRREEFVESEIVRPFIDKCVETKALTGTTDNYEIVWPDLSTVSDKDKAEVGKIRADALDKYTDNPISQEAVPPEAFMKYFLGLEPEQIKHIQSMAEEALEDSLKEEQEKPTEAPIKDTEEDTEENTEDE